jgi:phosphatidylethanolamine/phosphatidyl-N-methylethanolamine N-methyltransferase
MSVPYIERVYNAYAGVYDVVFGKVFQSGREMAPALLNVFPGAKLLEVGIGTGLSLPLLSKNIDITGIDLSQKMLDHARKRVKDLKLKNVRLVKMDATKLEFPDNSFDRVLAAYFISTVPDPVKVVEEMKRVCRPGGYLVFLNHFQSDNGFVGICEKVISPLFYRIGFRTDLNLHKLFRDTGLPIETLERIDFLGHWKAIRCINPEKAVGQ